MRITIRDILFTLILAIALALVTNTFRRDGIPLIAKKAFEILVPCPGFVGEATAIQWDDLLIGDPTSLVIDVRSQEEFTQWHLPRSINQPFDWLAEQDEINTKAAAIARTIARTGKHHVVTYGDGENPDAGEHWAALLAESGIKNVVYIDGGANALHRLKGLSGKKR